MPARPSSASSIGVTTVPFTPRPAKRSTSSRLTLSEREISKIAGTLASVRKVQPNAILEELEYSAEGLRADIGDNSYYPAESSFRHRPLSSRVPRQRSSPPKRKARVAEEPAAIPEDEAESNERPRLLDGVPLAIQEAWICEDLGFVMQGVEGALVIYDEDYDPDDEAQRLRGVRWKVDPSLDPSLLSLVQRLLPLATYYTAIDSFMELRNSTEYGMVNHALASGIRELLKEYHILTAQLESLFLTSTTFTLQTLFFHLHPTLHTLSLLYSLCLSLDNEQPVDDDDDDDDLGLDPEMAAELGLGDGFKNLMKDGLLGGAGLVLGGEVLGVMAERGACMSGDPTAATLHSNLMLHASQPYARMLVRWITTGYLSDPYDEFMVKESGHITKGVLENDYTDEYWDRRYTLRDGSVVASTSKVNNALPAPSMASGVPSARQGTNRLPGGSCVPSFLQPWKFKILLAGKYLNVIRECGIEVKKVGEEEEEGLVVLNDAKFYRQVEDAYIFANRTLLKLMLEERQLIPHLRSMKHFFFLDQSEFLTNFLDLAGSELRKPAKSASIVKLQSLLDLAVRNPASSSSSDPYKDDLKVTMQSQGLYDWLLKIVGRSGEGVAEDDKDAAKKESSLLAIDALAFDCSVAFPLSLVISRKTITRYQLIFRFLLHLHHLKDSLSAMWVEHKAPQWRSPSRDPEIERWKTRIFSLRARMLAFVHQVLAFATGEVLETNWRALEAKLAKVETVDQLLRDHVDFLDTCLKQCMLTTSKLLSVYSKLMTTMSKFVSYQPLFNMALTKFLADPEGESAPAKVKQRWDVLQKFEVNFNHHTQLHLDAVTYNAGSENVALLALVTRLHQTTLRL